MIHPKGYYFDEEAAADAVAFFEEYLVHVKGVRAGQPFLLEKWQTQIVKDIYGWKRPDGTRQYRTAYIEVPRKNGKSTMGAGFALKGLLADGEEGAEVYSVAGDHKQARVVFDIAKHMAEENEMLREMTQRYKYSITDIAGHSSYKAIVAVADSAHGSNPSTVIFDELHVQKNRDLWDAIVTGQGAREQPLLMAITTAGFARNTICREQHDYARKVLDGIIDDPSFYPVIYAADEDADWTTPKTWAKANPNLGVSVELGFFKEQVRQAVEQPSKENSFKRLHLNIWTEQDIRWIPMKHWDECDDGDVALEDLEGCACYAGLDLASTTDIAAFVLVFPVDGRLYVRPWFWVPKANARKREQTDRVPYLQWEKEGYIELTQGNVIDFTVIRGRIKELGERFDIREIAVDRWNSQQLQTELSGDGFEMVPFGQGYASMSAPTRALEIAFMDKKLAHFGNPVLRWMASNVAVEQDAADNMKPSKKHSYEKIDGIVALIMALGRVIVQEEEAGSVYDERGLLLL